MKTKGFTLIELMVTISIIGILIVLAAPNFSGPKEDFRLYTIARELMLDIRYAQQLSIDTKDVYGIFFSTTGYQVKNITKDEVSKTKKFPSVIQYQGIITSGSDNINFDADGVPSVYGKIDLLDRVTNAHSYVKVTRNTGEVSIE